jgi:hypothetical protein
MNKLTLSLIAFVIIALGAFDIFTAIRFGVDSTVSWQLYNLSRERPVCSFLIGFLMGHIFWVQKGA